MLFLAGSVLLSAWLNIVFKLCNQYGINVFQTIVYNYIVCVLTGLWMLPGSPGQLPGLAESVWPYALMLGLGFILTFNLTALTVKHNGVATATVATKVSLVIPFLASLMLYGDQMTLLKGAGMVLTLVAVVLTFMPKRTLGAVVQPATVWQPVSIFIGCGLLDTLVKYVEHYHLTADTAGPFLVLCFGIAGIAGIIGLIGGFISGSIVFQTRALWAGVLLGIPNYFSIWCLIRLLKVYPDQSSVWIPVNNVAIVIVNVLVGMLLFRESLSRTNKIGIGVALLAILLLSSTST